MIKSPVWFTDVHAQHGSLGFVSGAKVIQSCTLLRNSVLILSCWITHSWDKMVLFIMFSLTTEMKLQLSIQKYCFSLWSVWGKQCVVFWKLGEWELERLSSVNNKSQEHQGKSELQKYTWSKSLSGILKDCEWRSESILLMYVGHADGIRKKPGCNCNCSTWLWYGESQDVACEVSAGWKTWRQQQTPGFQNKFLAGTLEEICRSK